jgi:ribosomal protein S18 acetylase RimI-like enzyme
VEEGYVRWFGRELRREAAVILVAARGTAIVGYAYATLEQRDFNQLLDEHAAVHDIVVASDARRAGIGRRLLTALIETLEELGAPRIVLHTMVDNHEAQALFRSVGFRATMFEMTRNRKES